MKQLAGGPRAVPGGTGAREAKPVNAEFLAMGGDLRFLEFAAEQARSRFGYLDAIRLPPGKVQGLLDDLAQAKDKVDELLKLFPHPTEKERRLIMRSMKSLANKSNFPHMRHVALKPFFAAFAMANDLDEHWITAKDWQRYERQKRTSDSDRAYWLSVLAPYTALLSGEPKWKWITRWFEQRFAVKLGSSLGYFWRDNQKRISKAKSDSLTLLGPATVFLDWLERQKNIPTGLRREIGEHYVGCIIENFPGLDPWYYSVLENILDLGVQEVCGPPPDSRPSRT